MWCHSWVSGLSDSPADRRATGLSVARRSLTAGELLTPQELQIALQVAEGKSNRDVAAALFLSSKTVEFHLTRVYQKLDVRSRTELVRQFAGSARVVEEGGRWVPAIRPS